MTGRKFTIFITLSSLSPAMHGVVVVELGAMHQWC
jgi:hypothetical protein